MNKWINQKINEWINDWINGWIHKWMKEWMNEWVNKRKAEWVYLTAPASILAYLRLLHESGSSTNSPTGLLYKIMNTNF